MERSVFTVKVVEPEWNVTVTRRPVGVHILWVASGLSTQLEPIASKRPNQFTGGDGSQATVVDGHGLDGDGDAGDQHLV